MKAQDIKNALKTRGLSLIDFDDLYGFNVNSTSECLRTGRPTVEKRLSEFLDIPLCELFPDRYYPDGIRKNPRDKKPYTPKNNTGATAKIGQST